ncbi:hypothetical protein [Mycoavidus sp. B2-EB]|uniref:hypothetical protein n=1 Tax=Mycoavidus sp. B2-EB TaxID=2651972 RepID=UPI001628743D|nr:hypothetical protein [Mycoavidus sp. B2-EB]BBO59008.1 hypothetical protein MPB2EB_0109 [Mycoavidus sp. B2-EB]
MLPIGSSNYIPRTPSVARDELAYSAETNPGEAVNTEKNNRKLDPRTLQSPLYKSTFPMEIWDGVMNYCVQAKEFTNSELLAFRVLNSTFKSTFERNFDVSEHMAKERLLACSNEISNIKNKGLENEGFEIEIKKALSKTAFIDVQFYGGDLDMAGSIVPYNIDKANILLNAIAEQRDVSVISLNAAKQFANNPKYFVDTLVDFLNENQNLISIENLDISYNQINSAHMQELIPALVGRLINRISMSGTLNPEEASKVADTLVEYFPKMHILEVSMELFSFSERDMVRLIKNSPEGLTHLELGFNNIDEGCAINILNELKETEVQVLDLTSNRVPEDFLTRNNITPVNKKGSIIKVDC